MSSQLTGSFWLCPSCNRHVPSRTSACHCGFDRVAEKAVVPVVARQPGAAPRPDPPSAPKPATDSVYWKVIAGVCAGGLFVVGVLQLRGNAERKGSIDTAAPGASQNAPTPSPAGLSPAQEVEASQTPRALTPAEQVELAARRMQDEREQLGRPLVAATPEAPTPQLAAATNGENEVRRADEEERKRRSDEEAAKAAFWRGENEKVLEALRAALSSYQIQLCSDMRGAISLWGGGEDMRAKYLGTRSQARDFEERAGRAGARSMVEINWGQFPEPEAAGPVQPTRISLTRVKWKCP